MTGSHQHVACLAVLAFAVACTRDDSSQPAPAPVAPTPPSPAVQAPPDAVAPIPVPVATDAMVADAIVADAPTGKPGGIKGTILFQQTTPANSKPSPVTGCSITATHTSSKQAFTATTDAAGSYRIDLPPGRYALDVSGCKRGYFNCGASNDRAPAFTAVIEDGNWPSFNLTTHSCNRCLDARTQIATPTGSIAVIELRAGDAITVVRRDGSHASATVLATQRIPHARDAHAVRLTLADGRKLTGSSPHPLADGRALGALRVGDTVAGSTVLDVQRVPYADAYAYDLLPSFDGAYIADGIPLVTTMPR